MPVSTPRKKIVDGKDVPTALDPWILKRLFARVKRVHRGCHDGNGEPSECWEWQGRVDDDGYGRYHLRCGGVSQWVKRHRLVWAVVTGDFNLAGVDVHHLCGNRRCCNPAHLERRESGPHRAHEGELPF